MVNDKGEELFLDDLIPAILSADSADLEDILEYIKYRYSQLFPQWELHLIFLEEDKERTRQIDRIIAFLERLKAEN